MIRVPLAFDQSETRGTAGNGRDREDRHVALVPVVLAEYGERTRAALAVYLRPREPRRHLYDLVADYPQRGGRMLRPSLCIASARAFGAPVEDAVHAAVALELMHNAFLVHDDVEDGSDERRGRPTLNALHGIPIAVNVGDALIMLGLKALRDGRERLGPWLQMRVLDEAERMVCESIEGQAIELGWRHDNVLDLHDGDYLAMVLKKTCWYTTIFPARVGALIGTRGAVDPDRFLRFGFFLGAAFQIQDDLLNLDGDPARYGKELGGDIWEGKRTLMLIRLLQVADAGERARLADFLARERRARTESEVVWVRERMAAYGCLDYARRVAHGLAGAALHEYAAVYEGLPASRDKDFIAGVVTWVIERG